MGSSNQRTQVECAASPTEALLLLVVREVFQQFAMPPELANYVVRTYIELLALEPACLVSPWFGLLPGVSGRKEVSAIAENSFGYPTQWYFTKSYLATNYPGWDYKGRCVIWTTRESILVDRVEEIDIHRCSGSDTICIPQPLKRLGFNMSMSYSAINKMLTNARCPARVTRKPFVHEKYGFMAELEVAQEYNGMPYFVKFGFNACKAHLSKETDENTLWRFSFSSASRNSRYS